MPSSNSPNGSGNSNFWLKLAIFSLLSLGAFAGTVVSEVEEFTGSDIIFVTLFCSGVFILELALLALSRFVVRAPAIQSPVFVFFSLLSFASEGRRQARLAFAMIAVILLVDLIPARLPDFIQYPEKSGPSETATAAKNIPIPLIPGARRTSGCAPCRERGRAS